MLNFLSDFIYSYLFKKREWKADFITLETFQFEKALFLNIFFCQLEETLK